MTYFLTSLSFRHSLRDFPWWRHQAQSAEVPSDWLAEWSHFLFIRSATSSLTCDWLLQRAPKGVHVTTKPPAGVAGGQLVCCHVTVITPQTQGLAGIPLHHEVGHLLLLVTLPLNAVHLWQLQPGTQSLKHQGFLILSTWQNYSITFAPDP